MFGLIKNFISYWYFRYLLVTELYMVEKWERAMFHIILFTLMTLAYLFNTTVVLGFIRMATNSLFATQDSVTNDYLVPIDTNKIDL